MLPRKTQRRQKIEFANDIKKEKQTKTLIQYSYYVFSLSEIVYINLTPINNL